MSGMPERTVMDILAGIREPELGVVCRIADGLGICVHELRAGEEQYAIFVQKDRSIQIKMVCIILAAFMTRNQFHNERLVCLRLALYCPPTRSQRLIIKLTVE